MLYIPDKYLQAASVAFMGSLRSSMYEFTSSLYCKPVLYINCHKPVAPTLLFAFGFNADSTIARYLTSIGMLYFDNASSNKGK